MSNPILLATDLSGITYGWSGELAPIVSFRNLKDGYPDTTIEFTLDYDEGFITIDFGSAISVDTLIVDGHNWFSIVTGGIRLQYNSVDNGTWSSPVDVIASISPINNNAFIRVFNQITKRYLRIFFEPQTSPNPIAGNIYISKRLVFETTQQWGYMHNVPDWSEGTSQSRATDGRARTAEVFGPIRKFQIAFGANARQSDALIAQYLDFLSVARMRPFYYIDHAGVINCVRWSKTFNPYKAVHVDQNTIDTLEMESVLAG